MTDAQRPTILIVDDEEGVRKALLRVLERGGYRAVLAASSGEEAREVLDAAPVDVVLTDMQMPGSSGLDLVRHVRQDYPGIATLMVTGQDDPKLADEALSLGAYGYIIKPFRRSEVLIGVANALRRRALELDNLAHREQLEEKVRGRTAELRDAIAKLQEADAAVRKSRSDTINKLAIAGEFRDEQTGRHVARMSRYAELLAEQVAGDTDLPGSMREASSLHDVGKIGIPDSILLKPGSLTHEERLVMQQHAEIGYRILTGTDSPLLELAASVALTHHEKFDGTGYPAGLMGDAIPLSGRIAAIADVFDALTTTRVYRKAYPLEEALEMMAKESGRHFDPALLRAFESILPDVLAVAQSMPSEATDDMERFEWEALR